ncbi:MAG TPA: UxaA family hydrolase, partial [Pelobium sp.]
MDFLQIDAKDNVLVALQDLQIGKEITFKNQSIVIKEVIPAKHKFFINDMKAGDQLLMYGVLVGKLQNDVQSGERMTVENTKHAAEPYFYRAVDYHWEKPDISKFSNQTFNGYHRSNGSVGTANYWLFIPTVFCENRNLDVIKQALHDNLGYSVTDKYKNYAQQLLQTYQLGNDLSEVNFSPAPADSLNKRPFKNVDGIKFLNHQGGCGGTRQDSDILSKLLVSYADHPNVAGVTLLSLGCQHLQIQNFLDDLKNRNPNFDKPLYIFEQQKTQSEEALIKHAIKSTFLGLIDANKIERKPAPLSKLTVGVKCGGSDGFSGISANPSVGYT